MPGCTSAAGSAVDLIASIPFTWIFFVTSLWSPSASVEVGAVLDIIMVTKLMKMAKISKVSAIFNDIKESLNVSPALMRLVTFGFWFVTEVHLMACGWVLIGASEHFRPLFDQYLRGVYWCVTTIATIGYGDYTPSHDSNVQIIYTMIVMIFGVGMYGYIIGNVATLIANLDVARANYQAKMEEINDFLRTRRVPGTLQSRVRNYYAYLWETQKSIVLASPSPRSCRTPFPWRSASSSTARSWKRSPSSRTRTRSSSGRSSSSCSPWSSCPTTTSSGRASTGTACTSCPTATWRCSSTASRVASLGQGSPFGETALIQGEKRMASIRALSYCDVYKLSKTDFDALRGRYPDFDAEVKKVVEERLKDTQEKTQK